MRNLILTHGDLKFGFGEMKFYGRAANWAEKNGWKIIVKKNENLNLSSKLLQRYDIPFEYEVFLKNIETCVNKDDTLWFFCADDYNETSEEAFKWFDFEKISIEAAENNTVLSNKIKNYWSDHLPIIFKVKDRYEYYAINIRTKEIVYGCEPEFEECKVVANDFLDFLKKVITNSIAL